MAVILIFVNISPLQEYSLRSAIIVDFTFPVFVAGSRCFWPWRIKAATVEFIEFDLLQIICMPAGRNAQIQID
jgi:hypothetical protein